MTAIPPPLPNSPVSGILTIIDSDVNAIGVRPMDRINIKQENKERRYIVLSVREESDEAHLYEYENNTFETFNRDEILDLLSSDESYQWSILIYDDIKINQHPNILLAVYAFEHPEKTDWRFIAMEWYFSNGNLMKTFVPEPEGVVVGADFRHINTKIKNGDGDLSNLYPRIEGRIDKHLRKVIVKAEFNAHELFDLPWEKTYSERKEKELLEESRSLQKTAKENDLFYD